MLSMGPVLFASPWLLTALAALPLLWWLLRLVPPAPRFMPFPAIRLLFGLRGEETVPRAAPWWLVFLRLGLVTLLIVAAARPILNPDWTLGAGGPVAIVIDDGWAAAPEWDQRIERAIAVVNAAERAGRPVYLITGAPPASGDVLEPLRLQGAAETREALGALEPKPWPVDRVAMASAAQNLIEDAGGADIFWFTDGLDSDGAQTLSEILSQAGTLTVLAPDLSAGPIVLRPPSAASAQMSVDILRPEAGIPLDLAVIAFAENGRPLARRDIALGAGDLRGTTAFDLPLDIRNEIARLVVENRPGAAATALIDRRWSRRPVGIVADIGSREVLPLLSEIYFLDRALQPWGSLGRGRVDELLDQDRAVLILPDDTVLDSESRDLLDGWLDDGGVAIRFAGPRLAAAPDDLLTPVRLRGGGRQLTGAMQWTEPARIGSVADSGPFAGMRIAGDVTISRQVLAEPSLDLDAKTWMRLEDDTPLVTAEQRGDGWLVLIHTTANTEWSDLALSGMFVEMLERLMRLGQGASDPGGGDTIYYPLDTLDGFGRLSAPQASARPLSSRVSDLTELSAELPPGFYGTEEARVALNLGGFLEDPVAMGSYPAGAVVTDFAKAEEIPITPYLLLAALLLLTLDTVITTVMRGYAGLSRSRGAGAAAAILLGVFLQPADPAMAQDAAVPPGALATTFAYVLTGDEEVDRISAAGLQGLSQVLTNRTAVEPGPPVGVDIDRDEIAFYPLLYWPVMEDQGRLPAPTADRINRYMAAGGMVLFDTRDGYLINTQTRTASDAMREIVRSLDIPPLIAVPADHVLTRSFYLMDFFPGRWSEGVVWVEEGGNTTNDGVSPVVVGSADWAAAWALDNSGRPLLPIGNGGEAQRELAYRFGVNLVMYTLTGNYKSDQVHVPSILERLGQ